MVYTILCIIILILGVITWTLYDNLNGTTKLLESMEELKDSYQFLYENKCESNNLLVEYADENLKFDKYLLEQILKDSDLNDTLNEAVVNRIKQISRSRETFIDRIKDGIKNT